MKSTPDLETQCISMLERVEEGDTLYNVTSALLEAVMDNEVIFAVVQNGADPQTMISGLESRLKAKGFEGSVEKGILQTVERLRLCSEKINVLSVVSPGRRGMIYCNLENTKLMGLTIS